jgi:hypothetical protein
MVLQLLLSRDGGQPVLPHGLSLETLQEAPRPPPPEPPKRLWNSLQDFDSLPVQRWGLVAPEGPAGERLLALVEPLRRRRQEQQGGAPVRVYRVPRGMDPALASHWKQVTLWGGAQRVEDVPRYLLVLGDLDEVPLEVQQVLAADAFVGRLAFAPQEEAGYAAYVEKVLRWEDAPAPATPGRTLFYTAWRDNDATVQTGYQELVVPNLEACRERQLVGSFPAGDILDLGREGGDVERLLALAAEPVPSLLFSLSHGLGRPSNGWSPPEQRLALQGALQLPGGQTLTGADIASRPFLPGGLWFCFACHGAGTPARSHYEHWLRQLPATDPNAVAGLDATMPRDGEKPFIAALPKAALANPQGPLAVMGHVDLAWAYSYSDRGRRTPARFLELLKGLAAGSRAGLALSALMRSVNETSIALAMLYDREQEERQHKRRSTIDPVARAHLWMLRQDLAGYILLGDPAVRLPRAEAARVARPSVEQQAQVARRASTAPGRSAVDMERALLALLSGKHSAEDLAARHGVSTRELHRWEDCYRAAGREALARLLTDADTE